MVLHITKNVRYLARRLILGRWGSVEQSQLKEREHKQLHCWTTAHYHAKSLFTAGRTSSKNVFSPNDTHFVVDGLWYPDCCVAEYEMLISASDCLFIVWATHGVLARMTHPPFIKGNRAKVWKQLTLTRIWIETERRDIIFMTLKTKMTEPSF